VCWTSTPYLRYSFVRCNASLGAANYSSAAQSLKPICFCHNVRSCGTLSDLLLLMTEWLVVCSVCLLWRRLHRFVCITILSSFLCRTGAFLAAGGDASRSLDALDAPAHAVPGHHRLAVHRGEVPGPGGCRAHDQGRRELPQPARLALDQVRVLLLATCTAAGKPMLSVDLLECGRDQCSSCT
jgi:hypothetical protein